MTTSEKFDLVKLKKYFEDSILEQNVAPGVGGIIDLDDYLLAFKEMHKFLILLGSIFGLVASDIQGNMNSLRRRRDGLEASKYISLRSMLAFEVEAKLIKVYMTCA
jgi:hypothetical protein